MITLNLLLTIVAIAIILFFSMGCLIDSILVRCWGLRFLSVGLTCLSLTLLQGVSQKKHDTAKQAKEHNNNVAVAVIVPIAPTWNVVSEPECHVEKNQG